MRPTVMRIPRMQARPPIFPGSKVIRSKLAASECPLFSLAILSNPIGAKQVLTAHSKAETHHAPYGEQSFSRFAMRGIVGLGGLRMKRIVVLGAGFAGLWSAVGAARKLAERNVSRDEISVTV